MKRLLLLALVCLLAPLGIHAQTAVSGNLKDVGLANASGSNTYVRFQLVDYGGSIPVVSNPANNAIFNPIKDFKPDANGNISGTIQGNDTITPFGTKYLVCIYYQGQQFRCSTYSITGSTFNLTTAIPIVIPPNTNQNILYARTMTFLQPTPANPWVIVHNFNNSQVYVFCVDLAGTNIFPDKIFWTDANTVTVSWFVPTAGSCLVMQASNISISSPIQNNLVANPIAPQTINTQPLNLGGALSVAGGITTNALTDSGLTPGNCVQAGPGGLLQTISVPCPTAGAGVTSLNTLTGALTIVQGANITVTPSGGNTLTIASTASGNPGTVTSVGLTTPPELSVANSPCTSACTLVATWNDEQPSTFLRGPGTNGIGGIFDGSVKSTGNSTSASLTLTPSVTTDWAFFLSQTTGSQSSPVSMPGPWVNQIQNGNIGAVFSNLLSSASPLTAAATFSSSNTWAGMMFFLQYQPATTPAVVQKSSVSGAFGDGASVAFSGNTVIGNTILVTLVGVPASSNFSTGTWTDSQGNIYTPIGQVQNGSAEVAIAAITSKITAANPATITFHTSTGPFSSAFMTVYELSNIKASNRTPYFGPLTLADMPSPLDTALQTKVAFPQSTTCPTGSSGGATCTYTLSWVPAWTDTLYVPVCTGVGPSNYPSIQGVAKSTNNIVVTVQNGTANMAMVSGYTAMGCIGVHP